MYIRGFRCRVRPATGVLRASSRRVSAVPIDARRSSVPVFCRRVWVYGDRVFVGVGFDQGLGLTRGWDQGSGGEGSARRVWVEGSGNRVRGSEFRV